MADLVAKFSLNKRQEIKAKFDAANRSTISAVFKITKTVSFHNELSGREEDDCHPIKAITGLQNAIDGKQDVIEDLETIRSGAAKGETALQPSALNNTTLTGNTTAEALKIDGYNALTTNSTLNGGKISEGSVNKNALATGVQTSLDKADSAVQTIETGTANGTISVDGTDVEVKGLDSAAFTPASDYATADQGEKADTAVQTVETGTTDGTISVDGTEVEVAGLGSAAFTDTDAYATAAQGDKADTALQPNDNISELTNNADYQTGTQVSESIGTHNTSTTAHNDIRQAISEEVNTRSSADQNLQQQIDAIVSASDVTDIVGTYAELQAYDTSGLADNSIIKVLQDESRDDETTYYRWVITDNIGSWVLIGEEGPYYTKSQADNKFVPQTTTINNKALSGNITLDAQDVGAQAALTVGAGIDITNGTISNTGVRSVTTGSTNGTVAVNTGGTSAEVAVAGLGTAAYEAVTSFDAAGAASTAETNAKNYADGLSSNYATSAQGALADSALQPNSPITGATKCKITYDSNGLVTAGSDLEANDIPSLTISKISDITATASELNVLDGITASTTELNYVDGVTSSIQTQLDGKQPAGNYVTTDTTQTISAAKTFKKAVHFTGTGDANAVFLTENTRIDVEGTTRTILGMGNGQFYINHSAYDLLLRGRQTRPKYNSSDLALTSDIPTTYIHEQGVASAVWTVQHNLNKYPSVTVVDSSENVIIADVEYVDVNTVKITMNGASKGRAYLN